MASDRTFDGTPSLHLDYYFLKDNVMDGVLTCIVMKERFSRMLFSYACDKKGFNEPLASRLAEDVISLHVQGFEARGDSFQAVAVRANAYRQHGVHQA